MPKVIFIVLVYTCLEFVFLQAGMISCHSELKRTSLIPQGRRTRTGGLTGKMVGSTQKEEKERDFTGTPGRRSAFDKQQAHD